MTVCAVFPVSLVLAVAQLKAPCCLHCVQLDTTVLQEALWDGSFLVQLAACRVSREPPVPQPACRAPLVWNWYIVWYIVVVVFVYSSVFLIMPLSPAGSYCSSPGLSQQTGQCQAGFYCPAGSTSPNATAHQVFLSFTIPLLLFMSHICSLAVILETLYTFFNLLRHLKTH